MLEKTIGNLIADIRREQNITQSDLCEGLCTTLILKKLESGERVPDVLLVDRFLQRLGKSPDMFEVLLSDEEYELMVERDEIEALLDKKEYLEAEKRIEKYREHAIAAESIQQQYYYQIKAVIEKGKGRHDTCISHLEKAINCTVPLFSWDLKRKILLCVTEIEVLIMLADEYFEVGKIADAELLLDFLIEYIEENYSDSGEVVKIYPKVVYLQVVRKENSKKCMQCLARCEKAFNYMIKEGTTIFLPEIMKILADMYFEMHLEKKARRLNKQLVSLEEVYYEMGYALYLSECDMGWFKESFRRGYYLCSEIVRGQRITLGLSQEEVSEGIYENPESLARVEAGRQMPTPKKLALLMEKLGLQIGRYNGYLFTNDYTMLEQRKKINTLVSKKEREDAKIELEKLRILLDISNPVNRQYLETEDALLNYKLGMISAEEFYEKSLKTLDITYVSAENIILRIPMKQEAIILNQLAISLWQQGRVSQGTELFRRVNNCYEKGKIHMKYQLRSRGVILQNYTKALEEEGHIEEAIEICKKGLLLEIMAGKGDSIDMYLSEKVCFVEKTNLDEQEKKKAMAKYLCQAFYISDLFENKENNNACQAYYQKIIGTQKAWY